LAEEKRARYAPKKIAGKVDDRIKISAPESCAADFSIYSSIENATSRQLGIIYRFQNPVSGSPQILNGMASAERTADHSQHARKVLIKKANCI
jgi:hypothetical protein